MKADNECFTQARWRRHAISRECRCQYGRIVEVVALGQGQTIVGKRQRLIFAEEFARGLGKDVFPVQITSRQDDIAPSVREVGPYSGADVEIRTVALVRDALLCVQFDTAAIDRKSVVSGKRVSVRVD